MRACFGRTQTPLTRTPCRIRQRRLADSAPPKGRGTIRCGYSSFLLRYRYGGQAARATLAGRLAGCGRYCEGGRNSKTCVFTKRTHRFLGIFLMQLSLHAWLATEIMREFRWVRFPKRTHREGVNEGERGAKRRKGSRFGLHLARFFYVPYVRPVVG